MTETARPRLLSRALWMRILLPLAAFAVLAGWSIASPIGASPDDDYHMPSIWCGLGERGGICEPGAAEDERSVPRILFESSNCFSFDSAAAASCPLADPLTLTSTNRGNFADGGYPPVFYAAMSVFASPDVGVSIVVMRLVNSALFVASLTALAAAVRRDLRRPVLTTALVALVPLGIFIVPSVNPSSWAVTSALGLWAALLGFYRTGSPRRAAALGALALGLAVMGAGARADSAVYNGIAVLVAGALAFERSKTFAIRTALPLLILVISLAFFFNSGQSGIVAPPQAASDDVNTRRLLLLNGLGLPQLWHGVFGTWGLGWLDTPMPASVWVLSGGIFAAFVFLGMRTLGLRKAIAMGVVVGSLVVVPYYILMRDEVLVGSYVQPRYILPLVILTAAVALVGSTSGAWISRAQAAVTVVLLTIAQGVALFTNLRRYVTGLDVVDPNLDRDIEWWWALPIGPMPVLVLTTLAFAVAAALLLAEVGRDSSSERSGRDRGDGDVRRQDGVALGSSVRPTLD